MLRVIKNLSPDSSDDAIFGRFMLYEHDPEARKKSRTFSDYVASFIAYGIMTALALGHIAFIDGIAK